MATKKSTAEDTANKNEEATAKVELSTAWDDDEDEDIVEDEETVFSGGESPYIQGYGVHALKITMAKRILFPKSKVEFIEIDFINQDGKTHREKFMVRGKDGKSYYINKKIKKQHFGVNKIKSLLKVGGVYPDVEAKKLMATLYSNTEESEVTYEEYGKEKTEDFTVFTDLIDVKIKACMTSKKENGQAASDQDDKADQKYVDACIKATKAFVKKNPKKKSLKKFAEDDQDYVNVYKYFVNSSVSHFCSIKGLFASEMDEGEGVLMQKFIDANDDGEIFDGRTLIVEDLEDKELTKLGINEYGKQVEPEDSDDDYEEPEEADEESESEDESEEW